MDRISKEAKASRSEMLSSRVKPPRSTVRVKNIPESMRIERRWVCWIWFFNNDYGKWTKKPIRPNETFASSTKAKTWSSFEDAVCAFAENESIAGIGFVLGDGWVGIDLDCCVSEGKANSQVDQLLRGFDSYSEISPTGTGVKIYVKGEKPRAWKNTKEVEIYESGRYFAVTGDLIGEASEVSPANWSVLKVESEPPESENFRHAVNSMRKVAIDSGEIDGSKRLIQYARQAVRCGLDAIEGVEAIRKVLEERPTPKSWTDDEIIQRIEQAERRLADETKSQRLTLAELLKTFPERKPELIKGLLREGEVMNVIAAPKEGKSWLMYLLGLSVASGASWLGHETKQGRVLVIDNELDPSELAFRNSRASGDLVIDPHEVGDNLIFEPLRGSYPSINEVDLLLEKHYVDLNLDLIILDAYYRLLPSGVSENDNAAVTAIFNQLDKIAKRHECSIALVHHASKGEQGGKSLTDVGSGAGALTRAADTHVVIRPHEDDAYAVFEAVCRSNPSPEPKTLRFDFPLWSVVEDVRPKVKLPKTQADRKQDSRNREAEEGVLKVLKEEVEATKKTIREKTGMNADRVNKAIYRLAENEQIQITKEVIIRGQNTELWAILDPIFEAVDDE